MTLNVHVKLSAGGRHTLAVDVDMTVQALKARIAAEPAVDIPAAQQRLIYKGRVLQDNKTLAEYGVLWGRVLHCSCALPLTRRATGVEEDHTIHLVRRCVAAALRVRRARCVAAALRGRCVLCSVLSVTRCAFSAAASPPASAAASPAAFGNAGMGMGGSPFGAFGGDQGNVRRAFVRVCSFLTTYVCCSWNAGGAVVAADGQHDAEPRAAGFAYKLKPGYARDDGAVARVGSRATRPVCFAAGAGGCAQPRTAAGAHAHQ
jgi:hypothetical protein